MWRLIPYESFSEKNDLHTSVPVIPSSKRKSGRFVAVPTQQKDDKMAAENNVTVSLLTYQVNLKGLSEIALNVSIEVNYFTACGDQVLHILLLKK